MDVSGYLKALEPPRLTVPRSRWTRWLLGPTKTYEGKILSHAQYLPFEQEFRLIQEAKDGGGDVNSRLLGTFKLYLNAIGIPQDVVLGLPSGVVLEVLTDFLARQVAALKPPSASSTSGKR